MGSVPSPVGNQLTHFYRNALPREETMHAQEVERANMARRAFYKKLEKKAADRRIHEDFLASAQPQRDERLQAERKLEDAERELDRLLEVRKKGAEDPYRQSLYNYRSWQENHPPQTAPSSGPSQEATPPQTPKKKKPVPLVVRTPTPVSTQQAPRKTAREKLEASVGPVQSNEMPSAHKYEWQLRSVMTSEVFVEEPEKRTDWTAVRSDYSHGAEAVLHKLFAERRTKDALPTVGEGEEQAAEQAAEQATVSSDYSQGAEPELRRFYAQRTKGALATIVEGGEQSAEQAADRPAETHDDKTVQAPECPPDMVGDESDSVRGDSDPETPDGEQPKDEGPDMTKVEGLGEIEGLTAGNSLISEYDA